MLSDDEITSCCCFKPYRIPSWWTTSIEATIYQRVQLLSEILGEALGTVTYMQTNLYHIRAMLHDPIDYPSPDIFNPSRFLTTSGKLDPKVKEPNPAFGYGRRFCPGRELAFDSMLITIASILATFDILPVVDESGVEAAVSGEYSSGLLW